MPTLPSATSIVDYLKSQGQDSSQSARKKLYNQSGLSSRLGEYTFSGNQNVALLKYLQNKTESPAPNFQPQPENNQTKSPIYIPPPTTSGATTALNTVQNPAPAPSIPGTTQSPPTAPNVPTDSTQGPTDTSPTTGTDATGILPPTPDEQTLIDQYMKSPEFQNFVQDQSNANLSEAAKTEAAKQQLDVKYATDKADLENKLAANGLTFSGIRASQVKVLTDSLAASKLSLDRDLASKLLNANSDLRDNILQGVADLVKQASEGRKEAIDQLNKAGFAVIGNQLVPTVQAEQQKFSRELAVAQFDQRLSEFEALQEQRKTQNAQNAQRIAIALVNADNTQTRNSLLQQLNTATLLAKTAASPGQIVNAATGFPANLTEGQRNKYAGYDQILNVYIGKVEDLLNKVNTGGAVGRLMNASRTIPGAQTLLTSDQQELLTLLQDLANNRLYTQSGAQINNEEFRRIVNTLPRPEFSNEQNKTQLELLKKTFTEIYTSRLRLEGLSIAGDTPSNPLLPILGEISTKDTTDNVDLSGIDFIF